MSSHEDSSPKSMNPPSLRIVLPPIVLIVDVHDIYVDGQHIVLSLWDTAGNIPRRLTLGQEEFDRLRTLSYADTHVIMLCFSVESRDSLENVHEKWWDEIARHCDGTPIPSIFTPGVKLVLVALKCDLRDDEGTKERLDKFGEKCLTYEQGLATAKTIKAVRYLGMYTHTLRPSLSVLMSRVLGKT
jgi:Rho family protein